MRIVLADDPVLLREGLVRLLTEQGHDVVGVVGDGPSLVASALSLRPDAVYFLSDGQFDPLTIQQLKARNRSNNRLRKRQIPIHTIAFMDRMTEGLMRSIARNSGGEYRFVGQ